LIPALQKMNFSQCHCQRIHKIDICVDKQNTASERNA